MNVKECSKFIWVQIIFIQSKIMNGDNLQKNQKGKISITFLSREKKTFFFVSSYSGADISNVCKEALLRPIRQLSSATHFKKVRFRFVSIVYEFISFCVQIQNPVQGPNEPALVWLACSPGDSAAIEMKLDDIHPDEICDPPVTMVCSKIQRQISFFHCLLFSLICLLL